MEYLGRGACKMTEAACLPGRMETEIVDFEPGDRD